MPHPLLTRGRVLALAWPMVFANATIPLASVVDTAVIGAVGDANDLGGIALGAALFNVVYWSFYFLRMGTTGLAAQAYGANDLAETKRVLARALLLAAVIGALVLLIRAQVAALGFSLLQGDTAVEMQGAAYFLARTWGAPGAFAMFAITGWLIGLGRTRDTLAVHVTFSLINIILDLWFVLELGWGVAGVGAATAIAEWIGAALGGVLAARVILQAGGLKNGELDRVALFAQEAWRHLFAVNTDLMLRTWTLVFGFTWFANSGARQGADVLAGNHVLQQFISVWAFVLDAFAFTAESEVGRAIGQRSRTALRRAVRLTSELAAVAGVIFLFATLLAGPPVLTAIIADEGARAAAMTMLPYCALIPFLGAGAWQLDGIFIGATRSAVMRNASIAAVAIYIALDLALTPAFGVHGMWMAFVGFYIARGACLAVAYPGLERSLAQNP